MIYVLAGNHIQAQQWARNENLKHDEWMYINGVRVLEGVRTEAHFIKIGTWYMRDNDELAKIEGMLSRNQEFFKWKEMEGTV